MPFIMPFISVHHIFIVQVLPLLKYGCMETQLLNKKIHSNGIQSLITLLSANLRHLFLYISQTEQKERKKAVVGKKVKNKKK